MYNSIGKAENYDSSEAFTNEESFDLYGVAEFSNDKTAGLPNVSKSGNAENFETRGITFSINEDSSELLEEARMDFVGKNKQNLDNFETRTINFLPNSRNMAQIQNGQKIVVNNKFQKEKARLAKELKKNADKYLLDKDKAVLEMAKICKSITNLVCDKRPAPSNALEKDSKVDRFKKYFENPEDNIKNIDLSGLKTEQQICVEIEEDDVMMDDTESHPDCLSGFSFFNESDDKEIRSDIIEDKLPEILKILETNDTVLIKGDTGCGKSTIIPRMLMGTYKNIVCTQPRRLAAINVARKVSSDIGCKLGTEVGYSIRFEDVTSKNTKLRYVTDGVLLNELNHWKRDGMRVTSYQRGSCKVPNIESLERMSRDENIESVIDSDKRVFPQDGSNFLGSECKQVNTVKVSEPEMPDKNACNESSGTFMTNQSTLDENCANEKNFGSDNSFSKIQDKSKISGYDLIIIDEAHERSINIDFLLGHLKAILKQGNVSTKVIIMSATLNTEQFSEYFNCPIVEIKQRRHEVTYFYLNKPVEDYLKASIQTVLKVVKKFSTGDIIVFLSGQEDIYRAEASLKSALSGSGISILKLFSAMAAEEQDLVFIKGPRKIILSTNVAETSITIENIKFVVDSGKVKIKRRSSASSVDFLEVVSISKAQAKQRAGRAGRTQPGIVFRAYTFNEYLEMKENLAPEILRTNLSSLILTMKNFGYMDILSFDFIDRPNIKSINKSIQFLHYLKAIDKNSEITRLGRTVAKLPFDPEIGMSLLVASKIGCLNSVSTIAAFLDYQTVFLDIKSNNRDYKAYKMIKSAFNHPKGDFYTFLNIYNLWSSSKFSSFFLKKNFLNFKTMHQIKKVKSQLLSIFPLQKDVNLEIERAFCSGFFMNVAKRDNKCYKTVFGDIECFIHPNDELFKKSPKYVLFYELFCVKKVYMNHCVEIDPDILSKSVNTDYKL